MITIKNYKATNTESEEIARVSNLVNHDYIDHPENIKDNWFMIDPNIFKGFFLLYYNQTLIGFIAYEQGINENQKTVFFYIKLDPNYNGNGYRKLLYQKMLKEVRVINCTQLLTEIYEHPNYKEYQNLLINNKFKLVQTNREYSCDIKKINIPDYHPLIQKLESEGIQFYDSKEELKNQANHYKKLEYLEWVIDRDIPIPNGIKHTRESFDQYLKEKLNFEEKYYGTEIIAVKNDEYIGSTDLSVLYQTEPFKAWTEGLGVLKEFRRKGIATALKIKAIKKLLSKGITEIRTDNELNNPMYKINENLGFYPVPFSLEYLKILD